MDKKLNMRMARRRVMFGATCMAFMIVALALGGAFSARVAPATGASQLASSYGSSLPYYSFWYTWAEDSGGATYGSVAGLDKNSMDLNNASIGCYSSAHIPAWSDSCEQTLSAFYEYFSTSFVVKSITYGLLMNYSQTQDVGVNYTLYVGYETVVNSTNAFQTCSITGVANYSATDVIQGNITIPNGGGYVVNMVLNAGRHLFSGGAFAIGFVYAHMYYGNTPSTLPTQAPINVPFELSLVVVCGFAAIMGVALLIILKKGPAPGKAT
jgi:hypothetical protein